MNWMRASRCPFTKRALEVRDGMSQHGARPLHRLAKLGLLRPGFSAVHMNHLDENDLALAQDTGISVIACPTSNLRLGSGICPTAELLQRNVAVALGSDFAMSAGSFDVLGEARLAALLSAAPTPGHVTDSDDDARPSLSAAEALTMATLGGALALGLGTSCGSIEPGKAADLVCIDLEVAGVRVCRVDCRLARRHDSVQRDARTRERCMDRRPRRRE